VYKNVHNYSLVIHNNVYNFVNIFKNNIFKRKRNVYNFLLYVLIKKKIYKIIDKIDKTIYNLWSKQKKYK